MDNERVAAAQTIARVRTQDLAGLPAEARRAEAGGKSELHRAARRVTPGQGNLTDSGTENIPP